MTFREHTMWSYVCDWPGCDADAQEDDEFTAWGEKSTAYDVARDRDDWHSPDEGENSDKLYCPAHWHGCDNTEDGDFAIGPADACCRPTSADGASR